MSIRFDSVSFAYAGGMPVFRDLSCELVGGECLLVVGHNGAGKSTLLKLLNGILRPQAGRVSIFGRDTARTATSELARDVCVTFQNPGDQIFASTVLEEASFGPRALKHKEPDQGAREALALCGLAESQAIHPYDLSQSARKLLTVASAVATGARILAFDEPSVSLSQPERRTLEAALGSLRSQGRTLVIVSHDVGLFLPLADRILVLKSDEPPVMLTARDVASREHLLRQAGVRLPYAERLERLLLQMGGGTTPTVQGPNKS